VLQGVGGGGPRRRLGVEQCKKVAPLPPQPLKTTENALTPPDDMLGRV
jgi:hypothetical protein